jgi:hypothetical protein
LVLRWCSVGAPLVLCWFRPCRWSSGQTSPTCASSPFGSTRTLRLNSSYIACTTPNLGMPHAEPWHAPRRAHITSHTWFVTAVRYSSKHAVVVHAYFSFSGCEARSRSR